MARTDRTDADAPVADDAEEAPKAVSPGDDGSDRALPTNSDEAPPATIDESAHTDAAGPPAPREGHTHELLAPRDGNGAAKGQAESDDAQLVSGDPLLRGPAPAPRKESVPPPPPPTKSASSLPDKAESPSRPPAQTTVVGGVAARSAAEPARRAARGASIAAPRPTVPPSRPPEQPVATLRPTTVAPVPRLAGRRPRVRRVTRVVRHVDPWSVFKVAAAFSVVAYAIALVAGVLLWNVAYATGTIDNIERGMESTGWEVFELDGGEIFHNAWIGGLFAAVALTGLAVLTATLFNLITDLVGGIRLTVLEEEVVEKTASPMRRFATAPTRAQPQGGKPGPTDQPAQGAEARIRRARGG
jgi:hypothetical protein